jgi:hypothetical protein
MSLPDLQTFSTNGEHLIASLPPGAQFIFEWDGVAGGVTVRLSKVTPAGNRVEYKNEANSAVLTFAAGDTHLLRANGRGLVYVKLSGATAPTRVHTRVTRIYKDVD